MAPSKLPDRIETAVASLFAPQRRNWRRVCHPSSPENWRAFQLNNAQLNNGASKVPQWFVELASNTPLMIALIHGHDECAALLVAAGADINVRCGPDHESPLHVCCADGNATLTEALIGANADCCAVDAHGRSPLLVACMADQPACASIVLAVGSIVEQPMVGDNPGATPLYAAAFSGSLGCSKRKLV